MPFYEEHESGLRMMRSTLLKTPHGFTTRFGGVSRGPYASLNLGSNRGDEAEDVRENYRRLCAAFGADIDGCCVTNQVHKNGVRTVTGADRHVCLSSVPYEADGIVTAEKDLPLFCFTADCVPALLWDGEHGVIGAIHCGWRSSVGDILGNALAAMAALGARPETIRAALGPAIGPCCFETGDDVPEAIEAWLGGDTAGLFRRREDGKTLVDLRAANARRLRQLGVPAGQIDLSDECTYCLPDKYWSHRYTRGLRGSMASGIVLR